MIVRQAANVFELLEFFAERKAPATLADVTEALGWPRSSAFNLLGTLVGLGYLYEPRARGGYYPTPKLQGVAEEIAAGDRLPEALRAMVAEIASLTGETTALGCAAGETVVFLHVVESRQPIRYFAEVGTTVPIHASSAGRAILGQMSPVERERLYRRIAFEPFSPTSPKSALDVEDMLARAAERGWDQSEAEYIADLAGVSMPLRLGPKRLSVVVAGPVSRCLDRRAEIARIMRGALERFGYAAENQK